MIYDRGEIVREYNTAKNKNKQVRILADLNQCHPSDIAQILFEEGCMNKRSAGQFKRSSPIPSSKKPKQPAESKPEGSEVKEFIEIRKEDFEPIQTPESEFTEEPIMLPVDYNAEFRYAAVVKHIIDGLNGFDAFCLGSALSSLFDWDSSQGSDALKKAVWFLNQLIEQRTEEA